MSCCTGHGQCAQSDVLRKRCRAVAIAYSHPEAVDYCGRAAVRIEQAALLILKLVRSSPTSQLTRSTVVLLASRYSDKLWCAVVAMPQR